MADLQVLVDRRLLVEVRIPGRPSRYAPAGEMRMAAPLSRAQAAQIGPEPCPCCGAKRGFDGGGRCNACRVAWPPEM